MVGREHQAPGSCEAVEHLAGPQHEYGLAASIASGLVNAGDFSKAQRKTCVLRERRSRQFGKIGFLAVRSDGIHENH